MYAVTAPIIESELVVANRYALDRPLDRNSRITTWLGTDHRGADAKSPSTRGESRVIVKLFRQRLDPESREQRALDLHLQLRRGRRWASLPRLLDHGWENGRRYMVFEYIEGEPLDALSTESVARLSREGRFRLAHSLLRAVFSLHEAGFLHLGISPKNVLIDLASGTSRLESWGYMVPIHCHLNHVPSTADFTPDQAAYASAELLAGDTADSRDDVFAIACITYQIIGGCHPYRGQLVHRAAQLGWRPSPLHSLTSAQNALVMKALSFERTHRSVNLDELAQAFVPPTRTTPSSGPSKFASVTGVRASRIAMTGAATAGIALSYGAWQLLFADPEIAWTESVPTVLPQASITPERPPIAPPPLAPASPADAARIAAELNHRVISGRRGRLPSSVAPVNETNIPLGTVRRADQGVPGGPPRRRGDRT